MPKISLISIRTSRNSSRESRRQRTIKTEYRMNNSFSMSGNLRLLTFPVAYAGVFRAFKTFGLFSSGIGIHYPDSTLVHNENQAKAPGLIIGQRIIPQVFLRAADGKPCEIQDLVPADTRFKIFIFAGDVGTAERKARLHKLAEEVKTVLGPFTPRGDLTQVFDILTISTAKKEKVVYTDIPVLLRPHWSK